MSNMNYMENLLEGVKVEWKPLADIAEIYGGLTGKSKIDFESGNAKYISYKNIFNNIDVDPSQLELVKVSENERQHKVRYGDILFTGSSEIAIEAGMSSAVTIDFKEPVYLNSFSFGVRFNNNVKLMPEFSKYLFRSRLMRAEIAKSASGVTRFNVSKARFKKILVPIPCPDNPEKSLAIQAEIVRILDAFTALIAELTAELNMRKKQYNHYQFELLKLTETTQQLSIGECCDIKKGVTPIKKATPGKYPLVATTEERQSSSEYQFDCPAVCVPLISSRGHGVASIDRIYYQDGKFALGNILCAIIPNDSEVLSAKFLRYYLFDKKDVLLVSLMRGGANVSLTIDSLKKVKIPVPPIAEQQRIVRALDKFDEFVKALPSEIELRQRQYAYYRDLLLSFPQSHSDKAV
ncbi:restriction endonuclease subunit S [Proteus vulgaris]|uniref:restriction endonuclease subunit S n=1 Tax=Proteus vulgaris TaxID=585 RepID=UPI002541BA3F|nr:restriction endonuclease subunit S [Proteus vulgaris]WIF71116.1 restriction endonuclease subunit S [Proteus vulgaris]